jgi:formylmethanofuran dehydrogenase subunit E
MKAREKGITSTANGSSQEEVVTCSKCGQLLRNPHEWVRGADGTIICATCYREILFPNINYHSMELFD